MRQAFLFCRPSCPRLVLVSRLTSRACSLSRRPQKKTLAVVLVRCRPHGDELGASPAGGGWAIRWASLLWVSVLLLVTICPAASAGVILPADDFPGPAPLNQSVVPTAWNLSGDF